MKKKSILLVLFMACFSCSYGQYCELRKEVKINDDNSYFWGMTYSRNMHYLVVNQGYIGTHLLDSSFTIKHSFMTRCGACGGGNGQISSNEQYFTGVVRNFADERDSVWRLNLKTNQKKAMVWPQYARYYAFQDHPQFLVSKWGEFWIYDYEREELMKLTLDVKTNEEPRPRTSCLLIKEDTRALIYVESSGLKLYNTKKWKVQKTIDADLKEIDGLQLSRDKNHYFYSSGNTVFVRNTKDHKLVHQIKLTKEDLFSFDFSEDLSFCLYLDKSKDMYYYDMQTGKSTLLLASSDYLEFWGVELHPNQKSFITGVNGNRVLEYRLFRNGKAPAGMKKVEIFEYSPEEAKQMNTRTLKIEMALKKRGYPIVLDNMVNSADRAIYDTYCKDHNFRHIRSKESLKYLGIQTDN